jgi:hypothetical protein
MEAAVLARQSSGAASLSTADAGVAGASGGFTGTGIATDGDSGAVVISSGSSGSGTGGDISVTVGSGDMSGGSFTLTGSASSGADGVSMEFTAGPSIVFNFRRSSRLLSYDIAVNARHRFQFPTIQPLTQRRHRSAMHYSTTSN